jgi:molybdopterin synthase catalytic subunit
MVEITSNPIDQSKIIHSVAHLEGGAICSFIGTVRSKTADQKVIRLEYECYEPMAISEINKIIEQAKSKWPVLMVAISHRIGMLQLGDEAVVLAVSTPHRKESFEACQFIIDTLKQTVPIWKKEVFEDGEEWVSAHP